MYSLLEQVKYRAVFYSLLIVIQSENSQEKAALLS